MANLSAFTGPLPYQEQLNNSMRQGDSLYNQVSSSQPFQQDLDAASNQARQQSAAYGIAGPLAATMASEAQNRVQSAFARDRTNYLMQLNQWRATQALQAQEFAAKQRQWEYEQRLAAEQRNQLQMQMMGSAFGGIAGGVAGYNKLGGLDMKTGALLGSGLGGAAGYGLGGIWGGPQ